MSMVEELKTAIASVRDAYAKTDTRESIEAYDLAYSRAFDLIRDHGQALVEAVAGIEKLNEELLQARNIIMFNDDEVARLSTCQIDAGRYRWLRSCHEGQVGDRHATVVMWADEPWEPEDGEILDQAIDIARTNASAGGGR